MKNSFLEMLRAGIVVLRYTKLNGEIVVRVGTLKPELIPLQKDKVIKNFGQLKLNFLTINSKIADFDEADRSELLMAMENLSASITAVDKIVNYQTERKGDDIVVDNDEVNYYDFTACGWRKFNASTASVVTNV